MAVRPVRGDFRIQRRADGDDLPQVGDRLRCAAARDAQREVAAQRKAGQKHLEPRRGGRNLGDGFKNLVQQNRVKDAPVQVVAAAVVPENSRKSA